MNRRRGLMLADATIALAVVATLAAVLVVLANRHARASRALAETRAAVRLAESALTGMQSGKPAPAGVKVRRLSAAADDGAWVEVTVSLGGQTAALIGLVPEGAAPAAGGPP